jgi:hypothetical protein
MGGLSKQTRSKGPVADQTYRSGSWTIKTFLFSLL